MASSAPPRPPDAAPPHKARPPYEPDPVLARRMLLTMFLVLLVYAATALPFFLLGAVWGLAAVAAAVVLAAAVCRYTDRLALWAAEGREVTADREPELHAIVERLCVSADLPKPRVAVSDLAAPNAFAAGSGPGAAVVCVTRGLRERLTPEELAGVLGHEMAHIANRDVLVASVAAFPSMCAELFLRFWLGLARRLATLPIAVLLAPVALAVLPLHLVGLVTSLALSRYRELCADTTGTLLTGRPGALAAALAKIHTGMADAAPADRRALRPVNALCVARAAPDRRRPPELLCSHPSLERRTARLTLVSQRLADGG
ncbi:M48 family metalloprotease [Actinomadura hibisca]|uniref:M48 family metalloprotease n=1 Tax=Actinomadura hibisca TaxID=68565 RepID=UPI000A068408|nr:M48 family metalloprotease [Actinomadura hibisca]